MSLMAYNVKKNDIIFTTTYSYISTAEVIKLLGAKPFFVDIDPDTYNIDTNKLNEAIKSFKNKKFNLRGVIGVNLFGNPFEYDKIRDITKKNNLFLIEDAAQSFGSKFKNRFSGTLGDISCFSFYPTKSLSCYGDGGAITTNNKKLYKLIKSIRVHGKSNFNNGFERLGLTGRLDNIQATVLLEKLKKFKKEENLRIKIAKIYNDSLSKVNSIKTQKINYLSKSTYSVFSLEFKNKKTKKIVLNNLKKNKIGFNIYYKKPMHLEKVFKEYNFKKGDFPVSEKLSENILSIPIDPYLNKKELKKIIKIINYEE
jgi:dTDP-4-amino-4,6-dideoxygalactose transaminase